MAAESDRRRSEQRVQLAQSLRHSVTRLARRLRQQDGNGLGPTLTSALASINRNGQLTHGELAALEQLAPPTITAIVAKMEAAGLITRTTDERDRRITRIEITESGIEQLDDVRHRRTEWLEAQLLALTDDELARLHAAADVLAKLTEMPEPVDAPTIGVAVDDAGGRGRQP